MTFLSDEVEVQHFVRTGDILCLGRIFGETPWVQLLWETRKKPTDNYLEDVPFV